MSATYVTLEEADDTASANGSVHKTDGIGNDARYKMKNSTRKKTEHVGRPSNDRHWT
jgi:hypothetical protein